MTDGSAGAEKPAPALHGRLERTDPGADDLFPAVIEFKDATYLASKAPGQGFIVWDAGTYTVDDESGSLTMSTATDSLETYSVVVGPDALEVTVGDGRTLRYERAGAAPSA